jgi:CheY-like chemotaxis protein
MVHGLASQLGGALEIESRLNHGTTVELWLPEIHLAPEIGEAFEKDVALVGSGTALVVDDEELVRMSTAEMLADLGYAIVEACSGEEAMRLIEQGTQFDVLVTDHLMPGMSGNELAAAVRSLRPKVPVLVVSGYARTEEIDPTLPRLSKPFRKTELAASLRRILR